MSRASNESNNNNTVPLTTIVGYKDGIDEIIGLLKQQYPDADISQLVEVCQFSCTCTEKGINPLDTLIGSESVTDKDKRKAKGFLMDVLIPSESEIPYAGTQDYVAYIVDKIYNSIAEEHSHYFHNQNESLTDYIINNNVIEFNEDNGETDYINPKELISYQSLAARLHQKGMNMPNGSPEQIEAWKYRDIAHRLSVPTLNDIFSAITDVTTAKTFTNKVSTGETLAEYAKRKLAELSRQCPSFFGYTVFDFYNPRILAIDLSKVVASDDLKRSKLFMRAVYDIVFNRHNYSLSDVFSPVVPTMYREYHQRKAESIKNDPNLFFMQDDLYCKDLFDFNSILKTNSRASRKWDISYVTPTGLNS